MSDRSKLMREQRRNLFLFILAFVQITTLLVVFRNVVAKKSQTSQREQGNNRDTESLDVVKQPEGPIRGADATGIVEISLAFLAMATAVFAFIFTPATAHIVRFLGFSTLTIGTYAVVLSLREAAEIMGLPVRTLLAPTTVLGLLFWGTLSMEATVALIWIMNGL